MVKRVSGQNSNVEMAMSLTASSSKKRKPSIGFGYRTPEIFTFHVETWDLFTRCWLIMKISNVTDLVHVYGPPLAPFIALFNGWPIAVSSLTKSFFCAKYSHLLQK